MKRACLVGINTYPRVPLQGCVNDVNDVAALLTSAYGFQSNDLTILTDAEATHVRIANALHDLVGSAKPGDLIFFHYSGHGTQVAVGDDVVDAICPVDCDFTSSDNLTAIKLASIFSSLSAGAHITWVCDSCYSGGLAGMAKPARNRYLPPPPEIQDRIRDLLQSGKLRRSMFTGVVSSNAAFIAGCGAQEGAEDANILGRYNGAFTYYFLRQVKVQPSSLLPDLCNAVATQLRDASFAQTPQVEGPPELTHEPFLGHL